MIHNIKNKINLWCGFCFCVLAGGHIFVGIHINKNNLLEPICSRCNYNASKTVQSWDQKFLKDCNFNEHYDFVVNYNYRFGKFHSENGPALIVHNRFMNSTREYFYLNGIKYSKEHWFSLLPEKKKIELLFSSKFFN